MAQQQWIWDSSHPVGCTGVLVQCAAFWEPHKIRDSDKVGQLQSTMARTATSQKLTLPRDDRRDSHGSSTWNIQT